MPQIYFEPDNTSYYSANKTTILKASKKAGNLHQHACGGRGKCSTCRVKILSGLDHCQPRNRRERKIAEFLHFSDDIRLACQTVVTGDVKIRRLVIDEIDTEIARSGLINKKSNQIGEEIEATLVFMDIYDFTSFTSLNQAYDVVHLLNRYYYLVGKSVEKHGGIILDYYGDGVFAIFGQVQSENHAREALNACMEIQEKIVKLTEYVNVITKHPFRLRTGVHSGRVIIGTMGMPGFEKLAVVGDAVNIASRIENANKDLDTSILISDSTKQLIGNSVNLGKSFKVNIKGKDDHLLVHEII